jgi:predicted 3-demethylubiquinone-9 3-methyltransferase (glyoxalase superfamily)
MPQKFRTHLMFEGTAIEAMNLYGSLFSDSEILEVARYGPDGPGVEGTIMQAGFTLGSQEFICIDSYVAHDFTFTPSMSIFIDCESEAELNDVYEQLSTDGKVLMPIGDYGFSSLFGWVNDRFGVSWQLNLP